MAVPHRSIALRLAIVVAQARWAAVPHRGLLCRNRQRLPEPGGRGPHPWIALPQSAAAVPAPSVAVPHLWIALPQLAVVVRVQLAVVPRL